MAKKNQSVSDTNGGAKKSTGMFQSTQDGSKKTLNCLFKEVLNDAYSCEKQLTQALQDMAKAADSEELQDAFKHHLTQTQKHTERLDKIFDRLQIEREEKTCHIVESIVEAGKKVIDEYPAGEVKDSALIIIAQKAEHFEIALYGSLVELADVLGYTKAIDLLDRTLQEEKEIDHYLSDIAKDVNDQAYALSDIQEMQEL